MARKLAEFRNKVADTADKNVACVHTDLSADEATEILLTEPTGLREKLKRYEAAVIKQGLDQCDSCSLSIGVELSDPCLHNRKPTPAPAHSTNSGASPNHGNDNNRIDISLIFS